MTLQFHPKPPKRTQRNYLLNEAAIAAVEELRDIYGEQYSNSEIVEAAIIEALNVARAARKRKK